MLSPPLIFRRLFESISTLLKVISPPLSKKLSSANELRSKLVENNKKEDKSKKYL